jgi:hypothetical protein
MSSNGIEFKIQDTGYNWTLFIKEPNSASWKRVQSSVDAKILERVILYISRGNKLKEVV